MLCIKPSIKLLCSRCPWPTSGWKYLSDTGWQFQIASWDCQIDGCYLDWSCRNNHTHTPIRTMPLDQRSERNIKTLNPKLQPLARTLIETAVASGIHVKVIAGLRTYEEQDELYAQGRSLPGKIVTKAKGGYSMHNFGIAFDVGIFSLDSKKYYGESPDYEKVGMIGESLGLTWGGRWAQFPDEPHFEYTQGRNLTELRIAYEEHGDALA